MADKILGFLGDLVEPAGGGEAEYVYVDFTKEDRTNYDAAIYYLISSATSLKAHNSGITIWTVPGAAFDEEAAISRSMIKGCKIDISNQITVFEKSGPQLKPFLEAFEVWKRENTGYENYNFKTMTKEEYYSTNPIPPIPFVIKIDGGGEYNLIAEDGMTFEEWANSDYNTIGLTISDRQVFVGGKQLWQESEEYSSRSSVSSGDYPANIFLPYYLVLM